MVIKALLTAIAAGQSTGRLFSMGVGRGVGYGTLAIIGGPLKLFGGLFEALEPTPEEYHDLLKHVFKVLWFVLKLIVMILAMVVLVVVNTPAAVRYLRNTPARAEQRREREMRERAWEETGWKERAKASSSSYREVMGFTIVRDQ